MRAVLTASLAAILAGASMSAALAVPSGGGSQTPSSSAPGYDSADDYRKGVEALKANRFDDARKSLAKVLRADPANANANVLAGLAAAGMNDLKAAAKHYERATKSDGKLVLAHRELGITYAKLGDRAKAEGELAKLRKLGERCGTGCADAKQIQDAIGAVQAALSQPTQARLQSEPPLLFASAELGDRAYLDAVALINEKKYEAAIEALERARITFGPHPDVLTYLGFANRKLKRFDIAETYYRAALAAVPTHKGATEYYGELMVERGDMKRARAMLARLDGLCTFGCAEADELRKWIQEKSAPHS